MADQDPLAEDDDDEAPTRSALDIDIEDFAAALQRSRTVEDQPDDPLDEEEEEDEHELVEDAELVGDGDIEELDVNADPPEEPTHPRRLYLLVDGRVHVVAKDRFVIGRVSAQCDLAIIDANVSRQHCAIERREGIFYVTDLGSTNGVQVEGVRVDDHPIEHGQVLVLSGHRIECSFEPPALEPVPVPVVAATSVRPTDVTGRLPTVPQEPEPEPEPELELDFEGRVEQRLAAIADDIAALRSTMQQLAKQIESLKGVDALAQLIQKRVQERRR